MDLIRLEGVSCRVHLGVPAAERRRLQTVRVDLVLELDLRAAGRADDFRKTADYWALEKAVRREAEGRARNLVEALAEDLAALALRQVRAARSVRVAVHKRPAVMPRTRAVVVEIERRR